MQNHPIAIYFVGQQHGQRSEVSVIISQRRDQGMINGCRSRWRGRTTQHHPQSVHNRDNSLLVVNNLDPHHSFLYLETAIRLRKIFRITIVRTTTTQTLVLVLAVRTIFTSQIPFHHIKKNLKYYMARSPRRPISLCRNELIPASAASGTRPFTYSLTSRLLDDESSGRRSPPGVVGNVVF